MKILWCGLLGLLMNWPALGQKYATRAGAISFFSSAPLEDIEAKNRQVAASFDLGTGQAAFVVPIKEFKFPNGLMQEHFNENYLESDKYPRATFSGRVLQLPAGGLPATGAVSVQVTGELTIHGVKRTVQVPGTLERQGDKLLAKAKFNVAPADYNIDIPALVREHIARSVAVSVDLLCTPQP